MIEKMDIIDENGMRYSVKIVLSFCVEKLGKEYIAYTVNDDGKTEVEPVYIMEVYYDGDEAKVKPIPKTEKNMVLAFYDYIRDYITGMDN